MRHVLPRGQCTRWQTAGGPVRFFKCWAQQARLCVNSCRCDFSQRCVGRDQGWSRVGPAKQAMTLRLSACMLPPHPAVQALVLAEADLERCVSVRARAMDANVILERLENGAGRGDVA